MITTVGTMKASNDAAIKRTLVTDMWFKHLLHAKLKAFVTRSGYKSDSDELCVILFCVLFFLPSSRPIFKSLKFFAAMPTIAVQSSYSLHISACIGYIHTMVSLQMLKPLTSRLVCGLLQPVCRYRHGKQM